MNNKSIRRFLISVGIFMKKALLLQILFFFAPLNIANSFEEIETITVERISKLDCLQTSLIKIFNHPSFYKGKKVCFLAYVYHGRGSMGFYPDPLHSEKYLYDYAALLENFSDELWDEVHSLPQGFPVYLQGIMDYHKGCWEGSDEADEDGEIWVCAPYGKSINLISGEVFIINN